MADVSTPALHDPIAVQRWVDLMVQCLANPAGGQVARLQAVDPQTALPREQEFDVQVSFTWKNLRTGRIMVQRKNFDEKASYFPTLGEDPTAGSQDAMEKLALSIVQELQADW